MYIIISIYFMEKRRLSAALWCGMRSVQFRESVNVSGWTLLVVAWSDVILGFCLLANCVLRF